MTKPEKSDQELLELAARMPQIEGKALVRQCCHCNEALDDESRMIIEARGRIEYIISHGLHEECAEELYPPESDDPPDFTAADVAAPTLRSIDCSQFIDSDPPDAA